MTWRNSAKFWCNKSHVDSQNDRVPSAQMSRPRFQMFAVKPEQTFRNIFQYFIISTPLTTRLLIEISFIWLPVLWWHIVVCGIVSQNCCSHLAWNRKVFCYLFNDGITHDKHHCLKWIQNWGIATGRLVNAWLHNHETETLRLLRINCCPILSGYYVWVQSTHHMPCAIVCCRPCEHQAFDDLGIK